KEGSSKQKVGTKEFAKAVIANLGKKPDTLKPVSYKNNGVLTLPKYQRKQAAKKELVGIDLFVHWNGTSPDVLAEKMKLLNIRGAQLTMITNRGIKVWPDGFSETFCTDHWRCRYKPINGKTISKLDIIQLLSHAINYNIDTIKTENLYEFDGKSAFSLGQGQ
ncbi:MAG: hypothetical protein RI909_1698, partial [Bacteroidota bacterium]